MSTRGLFLITGKRHSISYPDNKGLYCTVRLYQHSDMYPTQALGEIVQATRIAHSAMGRYHKPITFKDITAKFFASCIMSATLDIYSDGFGSDIDLTAEGVYSIFPSLLSKNLFGDRADIEWAYTINIKDLKIEVWDGNPNVADYKRINPLKYVKELKPEYRDADYATIGAHCDQLMENGWLIHNFDPFWSYK